VTNNRHQRTVNLILFSFIIIIIIIIIENFIFDLTYFFSGI